MHTMIGRALYLMFFLAYGVKSEETLAEQLAFFESQIPQLRVTLEGLIANMATIRADEKAVELLEIELEDVRVKGISDKEALTQLGETKVNLLEDEYYRLVAIQDENLQDQANHYAQEKYAERFDNPDGGFLKTYNNFMTSSQFEETLCESIENKTVSLQDNYLPSAVSERSMIEAGVSSILEFDMGFTNEVKKERTAAASRNFHCLNKQIQKNQFHQEEKQRSDGESGIKQIRTRQVGAENYHSNTHSGSSFCAIHNHANNIRTCGMGEFIGVLNGVEFRTRHNDYRLQKPVTDDTQNGKTEDVTFPGIPLAVSGKTTIEEEIIEMKEWFRAFKNQDVSQRNYRQYFKPILVYLEGEWTLGNQDGEIDEPFDSDRHHIDATSWLDLQEKIRYTSYTGTKSLFENLAHLPTKIVGHDADQRPILAQWNYRLSCHEIEFEADETLPLEHLKLQLDPATQKKRGYSNEEYANSRAGKFVLDDNIENNALLDKFMRQIPGKDNYGSNIRLTEFSDTSKPLYEEDGSELNAAYYHRKYYTEKDDGTVEEHLRSYSDSRLYFAHNTQQSIAGFAHSFTDANGEIHEVESKLSYAIAVEIIYLTPLNTWNPYNIPFGAEDDNTQTGSIDNPFLTRTEKKHYITPTEFYKPTDANDEDAADTAKTGLYAQVGEDKYNVSASGVHVFLPEIDGIGTIRQRYPIMPIFGEGSAAWKRLNAFEEILNLQSPSSQQKVLVTGPSHSADTTEHSHLVDLTNDEHERILNGAEMMVTTEEANGHFHIIKLNRRNVNGNFIIEIIECQSDSDEFEGPNEDNQVCFDHHSLSLGLKQ